MLVDRTTTSALLLFVALLPGEELAFLGSERSDCSIKNTHLDTGVKEDPPRVNFNSHHCSSNTDIMQNLNMLESTILASEKDIIVVSLF